MSAGAALGGHVAARLDLAKVDTPAYVTDLGALEDNLKLLASVMERAGVTIILALKGFAQWSTFPLVKRYLKGTTASSIAEARPSFATRADIRLAGSDIALSQKTRPFANVASFTR